MSRVPASQLTPDQKFSYAREALNSFHNLMIGRYKDEWPYTIGTLIDKYSQNGDGFIGKLGEIVYIGEPSLGQRRLKEAMERVVDKSTPQKLPTFQTFASGISEELTDFDWSILSDSALDVAKSVIQKGQKINTAVDSTLDGTIETVGFLGKNLKMIVPIVGLFAAFLIYTVVQNKSK